MNEYMIVCAEAYQHKVVAPNSALAIKAWLNEQGYDSIHAAATENYCEPEQIKAILIGISYE